MADEQQLSESMSQNVLVLLCFSEKNGALASMLVKAEDFVEPYNEIAARAIAYRESYREAPGKEHTADLFDDKLRDPKSDQGQIYQRILEQLYRHADDLNEQFVVDRLGEWVKIQNYKRALVDSLERIKQGGDNTANDVEQIFTSAISFQAEDADTGIIMSNPAQALSFLNQEESEQIKLGIDVFDRMGIVPTRKELYGFLGRRKAGKSMFCLHVTRQAMLQRWRTLYVSLELSEEAIAKRLFQNLFAIAKRREPYEEAVLTLGEAGDLLGFDTRKVTPSLSINDANITEFLGTKIDQWGTDLEYVRIKRFPTGRLTIGQLESFLDVLDRVHGFIPSCLIVDYPGIAKLNPDNYRLDLGKFIVDLRGIGVSRNMAVVAPHQSTRAGEDAKLLTSKHAAEDISLFATADNVITYNATPMERKRGLARLHAAAVRNDVSDISVVIAQAYALSQFVVGSAMENDNYWNKVDNAGSVQNDEEED
jgi:hypothetical protein